MTTAILTAPTTIKEQGNLHLRSNLYLFGSKAQKVIRYILKSIHKYHDRAQTFFESYETIADIVGCSERTVERAVEQARNLGILHTERRKVWTGKYKTVDGKQVKIMKSKTNRIWLLPFTEMKEEVEVPMVEIEEAKPKEETSVDKGQSSTPKHEKGFNFLGIFKSVLDADVEKHQVEKPCEQQKQTKKPYYGKKKQGRIELVPSWIKGGNPNNKIENMAMSDEDREWLIENGLYKGE